MSSHRRARLAGDVKPAERARLARLLGRAVMHTDGISAAVGLLGEKIGDLEGDGRLLVEAELVWMCLWDARLASRACDPVRRYAGLAGDAPGQRAMLAVVGWAMSTSAGRSAAVVARIIDRAFGGGAFLADEGAGSPLYAGAAHALGLTDGLAVAERELSRAVRIARETVPGGGLAFALLLRARTLRRVGRLAEAQADGLAAIAASAGAGPLGELAQAGGAGVVALGRAERGDDQGAFSFLAEQDLDGPNAAAGVLTSRAAAHLAGGRPAQALADVRLRQAGPTTEGSGRRRNSPTSEVFWRCNA